VAEVFTGRPGAYVAIRDTVASFKRSWRARWTICPSRPSSGRTLDDVRANAASWLSDHLRDGGHGHRRSALKQSLSGYGDALGIRHRAVLRQVGPGAARTKWKMNRSGLVTDGATIYHNESMALSGPPRARARVSGPASAQRVADPGSAGAALQRPL